MTWQVTPCTERIRQPMTTSELADAVFAAISDLGRQNSQENENQCREAFAALLAHMEAVEAENARLRDANRLLMDMYGPLHAETKNPANR